MRRFGAIDMLEGVAKPIASAAEHFSCLTEIMVKAPLKRYEFLEDLTTAAVTLKLGENLHFDDFTVTPFGLKTPFEQIVLNAKRVSPSEDWSWLEYSALLSAVDQELEIDYLYENALAHVVSFKVYKVLNGGLVPRVHSVAMTA
jgi:hypothetical protein